MELVDWRWVGLRFRQQQLGNRRRHFLHHQLEQPVGQSYDKTVSYPGFYEGAYYGNAYRGNNADEYIDYLGDAFREYSGSDGGFFPFAYSVSLRRNTWGKWRGLTAGVAGETHRAISEPIHNALEKHPALQGKYKARDPKLTTQAADEAAHRGYQRWHRELDDEVAKWLEENQDATVEEFEAWLRWRYNKDDLRKRFPRGLP